MNNITIKYSKGLENSTQTIEESKYWRLKIKLEQLGYKVEKL